MGAEVRLIKNVNGNRGYTACAHPKLSPIISEINIQVERYMYQYTQRTAYE